ncbi:hypothetical protein Q4578_16655 [Shimia thalassica]|jgi:hypothetical protein|uniref:hypothetical protein n=1 Tax=Shimia thalassica TaxID=1715693 RepID=UPI0026E2C3CC|nr:hypothetical protein [Shimia thalassica]MDO6523230.1 hypothetical protein [Shimia thalassica]
MNKLIPVFAIAFSALSGGVSAQEINGCGLSEADFTPALKKQMEGQWTIHLGPGERTAKVGATVTSLPLPDGNSEIVPILLDEDRLIAHFSLLGDQELAPLGEDIKLEGVRGELARRPDVAANARVMLDHAGLGQVPACDPGDMLRIGFRRSLKSVSTGKENEFTYEIYLLNENLMGGMVKVDEGGGVYAQRLISLKKE